MWHVSNMALLSCIFDKFIKKLFIILKMIEISNPYYIWISGSSPKEQENLTKLLVNVKFFILNKPFIWLIIIKSELKLI